MNGVVHQYVDMNARRSDNADDRLLTTDLTRQQVKLIRAYGGCLGAKSR